MAMHPYLVSECYLTNAATPWLFEACAAGLCERVQAGSHLKTLFAPGDSVDFELSYISNAPGLAERFAHDAKPTVARFVNDKARDSAEGARITSR
jgi:hypothetical protein